ncbi:endonuclease domain-containing protein [Streptomyces sp. NPDC003038]|uniref:endonuclease domain-containing protein n=1 Tax=unclassified Streptomyces TaxID=2593676 RepID=UPI0033A1EB53
MTVEPACWSWPALLPTEEEARRRLYAYAERTGCTPEQADVLWVMEKAANALVGDHSLLEWQKGRCALCDRVDRDLVCDHNHATGLVRGWLCRSCNTREGVNQEPGTIFSLYRERHPASLLGVQVRYLHPVTGELPSPQPALEVDPDPWKDAASKDIGL